MNRRNCRAGTGYASPGADSQLSVAIETHRPPHTVPGCRPPTETS